jgi:hypothetical protein
MRAASTLAPLLLAGLVACGGGRGAEDEGVPTTALPADWAASEPLVFERWVEETFPEDAPVVLSDPALSELGAALGAASEPGGGSPAVRAAVVLARSGDPRGPELLLERLERRVLGPDRASDAADVVAAAALAELGPADTGARLAALAAGDEPHPDLEVRVECAAGALVRGRDEVIPFLLEVLRIDTWAGREDERDFEPGPFTAWARGRAAEALSARADVPVDYRTDASIRDREHAASELEELLLDPPAGG